MSRPPIVSVAESNRPVSWAQTELLHYSQPKVVPAGSAFGSGVVTGKAPGESVYFLVTAKAAAVCAPAGPAAVLPVGFCGSGDVLLPQAAITTAEAMSMAIHERRGMLRRFMSTTSIHSTLSRLSPGGSAWYPFSGLKYSLLAVSLR